MADRESFWARCLESEEPTNADRAALAAKLSKLYNRYVTVPYGGGSSVVWGVTEEHHTTGAGLGQTHGPCVALVQNEP